jgi:Fe-coproporphyrin III synthase
MLQQSLYHTWHRYKTLKSHKISALPIVILMPHSACNCRCIMCDIWKGNKHLEQLKEEDVMGLRSSLKQLKTQQVLMSGGEALLNPNFFSLCGILKQQGIKISLLSTGLTLKKHAAPILEFVDEVIVSLDGPPALHDEIRNIPGAFGKLREGIHCLKRAAPAYPVSARTVIHKYNFRQWPQIIDAAKDMELDRISFLPADVSSHAFNREILWNKERQEEVLIEAKDLSLLEEIIEYIISTYKENTHRSFIAESEDRLRKIGSYYKAAHSQHAFPSKKCNAPWVSAVIEADGNVKPCFFYPSFGNIREQELPDILNGEPMLNFRKKLDIEKDETCRRCVCYLNLPPGANAGKM